MLLVAVAFRFFFDRVFFERNRAYWVTFRTTDGRDETHHFEVGPDRRVRIWRDWLSKGPLLFEGELSEDAGTIMLRSTGMPAAQLHLHRR